MPPEHLHFGGGAGESAINPLIAIYLLLAIVLILVLPRAKVIGPFLFAFFTIPIEQVVVVGGFHFTALRFLILAGLARRAFSRKTSSDRLGGVDWAVVLWSISAAICFCLEYRETAAVVRQAGNLIDALGGFLVVRFLIPDRETITRTFKTLAAITVVLGICMIFEQIGHRNVFAYLGGPALEPAVRNGRIRSGATLGYLHAGAFAGVLMPLFIWMWTDKESRMASLAGLVGSTVMVITSASSTSYLAYVGGLVGLAFWRLRNRMRLFRWGLVCVLVGLHLVMKAPVWALIQRIDLTGSSSGSQRYLLVDMTIRHFGDWWLWGTNSYTKWGWESWDLCNQFVAVALTGGLLTLIFYIAIFQRSFGSLGTARKLAIPDRNEEWFLWCLGSSLFATVVAHFGINYMAQGIMGVFPLIACIRVATLRATEPVVQTAEIPSRKQFASNPPANGVRIAVGKATQKSRYGVSSRLKERVTQ